MNLEKNNIKKSNLYDMYKQVKKKRIFTESWKKDDFIVNESIKRSECVSLYWKSDLENEFGRIANYKVIKWLPDKKYKLYTNSPDIEEMITISAEIEFMHNEYTGPKIGKVLIHSRKIEKPLQENKELFNKEINHGKLFIKGIVPEAIYRIGCYCCYGDGPNIEIEYDDSDEKYFIINYYIDFDFNANEYRHY